MNRLGSLHPEQIKLWEISQLGLDIVLVFIFKVFIYIQSTEPAMLETCE